MTLELITVPALAATRHGFFTRVGGASSGIFEGLNCGFGSSDQKEAVAINRDRVAEAMSTHIDQLATVHQTHSADVLTVSDGVPPKSAKADAMVTADPDVILGVLTADCQPVLFADPEAHVVGAAHAGWKGAKLGILEATLDAMEALGARREKTTAIIGPSISQEAYEVGPEFRNEILGSEPEAERHFRTGNGDRFHFDLPSYGLSRLQAAGVGASLWTGHCTYSDAGRFFSYRRSVHLKEADYGRLIATIGLRAT